MSVPSGVIDRLLVAQEVAAALADGLPVVALESTLISHGLPYPRNLEVATASEAAVRAAGAVPATVAVHDGRLRAIPHDRERFAEIRLGVGRATSSLRPADEDRPILGNRGV